MAKPASVCAAHQALILMPEPPKQSRLGACTGLSWYGIFLKCQFDQGLFGALSEGLLELRGINAL